MLFALAYTIKKFKEVEFPILFQLKANWSEAAEFPISGYQEVEKKKQSSWIAMSREIPFFSRAAPLASLENEPLKAKQTGLKSHSGKRQCLEKI